MIDENKDKELQDGNEVSENAEVNEVNEVVESTTEEVVENVEANEPAAVESEEVVEEEPVANEEAEEEEDFQLEVEGAETPAAEPIAESGAEAVPAVATEVEKKVEEEENPFRWYSLRVISGKERKIKERIELEIDRSKWKEYIKHVLVPSEKVYKIRNGKKVILERNILPGYILIEADPFKFKGDMVQTIANIPNVIHFLGKNNPIPMQQSEANRMLGKVDESSSMGEAMIEPFIVGETVKIIDGPFNEFVGDIQEVNEEKKKLKVIVKIFGRGTEVELNFMQVEKQT